MPKPIHVRPRSLFRSMLIGPLAIAGMACAGPASSQGWIDLGGRQRTAYYQQDSGKPGPIVLIVGGVHGDEPAGALAANQVRNWSLRKGRLIVVPRANPAALDAATRSTPGLPTDEANLNRNFPSTRPADTPRGRQAEALWSLVTREKPDWVLDLHEGFDVNQSNSKSVGSTIIVYPQDDALKAAEQMLSAVNVTIVDADKKFGLRRYPIGGSLARAAAVQLNAKAMIVETTTKAQPVSQRTRQHRIAVHSLLAGLQMIDDAGPCIQIAPKERAASDCYVALYDAAGSAGKGVPRVLQILGGAPGVHVERIGPDDIREGVLDQFDVVMFSGGTGSGQASALQDKGREAVRAFVRGGGGYVGICAGSYLACSGFSWGLGVLDAKTKSSLWKRGEGTVQWKMLPRGRDLFGLAKGTFDVHYANGPVIEPAGDDAIPDYSVLATYGSELAENNAPKGIMTGSPVAVAGEYGSGRVICFSAHPEQSAGMDDCVTRAVRWVSRRQKGSQLH